MSTDPASEFPLNCTVRIKAGVFDGYVGHIHSLDTENHVAIIMLNIFGRGTPVEVEFGDLERTQEPPE